MELQTALQQLNESYTYSSTMFFYNKINEKINSVLSDDVREVVDSLSNNDQYWWENYVDEHGVNIDYLGEFKSEWKSLFTTYCDDEQTLLTGFKRFPIELESDEIVIEQRILEDDGMVDHYEYKKPDYHTAISLAEDLLKHFNVA